MDDIHHTLGRIEAKLESLSETLTDHARKDELAWAKVNRLERKIAWAAGVASAIVFLATSAAASILKKVGVL